MQHVFQAASSDEVAADVVDTALVPLEVPLLGQSDVNRVSVLHASIACFILLLLLQFLGSAGFATSKKKQILVRHWSSRCRIAP